MSLQSLKLIIVFAISDAGTYLVVWKEDDNGCLQPMILWIAFRLAIIFGKDLVHAGGLGAAKSLDEFLSTPSLGCPRVHLYLVKNCKDIPDNFICYGHPNHEHDSYNMHIKSPSPEDAVSVCKQMYNFALIEVEKKKKKRTKTRSGTVGEYVGPANMDAKKGRYVGSLK